MPCSSSRATPWVAGVLTLVRQQLTEGRYRDGQPHAQDAFVPTGAMLRAIALNSAVADGAESHIPSTFCGWGAVNPAAAFGLKSPRMLLDVRNADGLATAETCRVTFTLEESNRLAVTLTWSEPPGAVGSDSSIVNNLDLRLTSPAGELFLGNNFSSGQSTAGGTPDKINSTEMVFLDAAPAGDWVIEVIGTEVNVGNPKQGFALVVSGRLAAGTPPRTDDGRTIRGTKPVEDPPRGASRGGFVRRNRA